MKKTWLLSLLIALVLIDLALTYVQNQWLTIDGDFSAIVVPRADYAYILHDPFGWRVLTTGGWYAAPDSTGYASFASRYRARFGSDPVRIATLAYDAVSLASALARRDGGRFTETSLLTPTGFAGADGVFRFRSDGTNARALAVNELRGEGASMISPAPKSVGSGT